MRLASFSLALLLAAPALAQDPIPDTTAAWRYFPLEVGNAWEYEGRNPTDGSYYERWVIQGETPISGVRYFVREEYRSSSDYTAWELERVSLLRFDTLSTQGVRWTGAQEVFVTCPLGADFNGLVDCRRYEEDTHVVAGYYVASVIIGTDTVPALAVKSFHPEGPVDVDVGVYAAPFGFHHVSFAFCGPCHHDLIYTRLVSDDGTVVEYGSPAPVSTEPQGEALLPLALAAFPNPTFGSVTLELAVPLPQTVTVEVFDVLGRRVHTEEHAVSGAVQLHLDGRGWAPGVYTVRVTTADRAEASARLVRR